MSTQHAQLTKQLKAVFRGGTKRGKYFRKYNSIKENNSFADKNYVVVVIVVQGSNPFYPTFMNQRNFNECE